MCIAIGIGGHGVCPLEVKFRRARGTGSLRHKLLEFRLRKSARPRFDGGKKTADMNLPFVSTTNGVRRNRLWRP